MSAAPTSGVDDDLPEDAVAVLTQLLDETRAALAAEEFETARETIDSAESVATSKIPDGDLRQSLLHGTARVRSLLDPDTEDGIEPDAADEYTAAMERRLPDA